jgi:tetratricopeptide (TPR) repeat protein
MDNQKYKHHFITMIEAGFVAVNQADEDSAIKLFKAAGLLNPEHALSKVGFGYMHLCKLELKQAVKYFNEVLEKDPENEMCKAFLGLSLSLNPSEVSAGEKILEETQKAAKDPTIKNLASSALGFVSKFVKKTPTPTQGAASHK